MENYGVKQRDAVVSIILSFVTCGIYAIYWWITLTDDVGRLSKNPKLSGGTCFLLTLVTCGIYGFYWAYLMGRELYNIKVERNIPSPSDNSTIYIILEIFRLDIAVLLLAQNDVNALVATN